VFFSDKLACLAIKLRRRIHRPFMMTGATQGIAFVFLTQFGFFKREYVCHA
jgi:type IV secretory pathway TrbD component